MSLKPVVPEDYYHLKKLETITAKMGKVAWVEISSSPSERSYTSCINIYNQKTQTWKKFTEGVKRDYAPKFSPNGQNLMFLSSRQGNVQIFVMDLNFGGERQILTTMPNGVTEAEWSPNGDKIAFLARLNQKEIEELNVKIEGVKTNYQEKAEKKEKKETERLKTDPRIITSLVYREGTLYHDERMSVLFVIDTTKENGKPRLIEKNRKYSGIQWQNNNTIIIATKEEEAIDVNFEVLLNRIQFTEESVKEETILNFNSTFPNFCKVSPNGKYVTYVRLHDGEIAGQHGTLVVHNFESSEEIEVNTRFDRGLAQFSWETNDELLLVVEDSGKSDVRLFCPSSNSLKQSYAGNESVMFATLNDKDLFFIATSVKHPVAVWKHTNITELIDDPNHEYLQEHEITEAEEMWFDSPDGFKFQGWFFQAKIEGEKRPPLALHIHGGPHTMWTPAGSIWHEFQCFLSAGYSVLACNPQGSSGYGEKFSQILVEKWGVNDSRDLLLAVDSVIHRVDSSNLFVLGGSYAGFQTVNLIAKDNRFKLAVAQRGVYNLTNFSLVTDIPLWGIAEWKGTVWERLDYLWEHSPLANVEKIQTPLLIIAAENDFRVPISQSEELFAALKLHKKEVVFIRYPRDGHELSRSGEPLHVVDRISRILNWFERGR